MLIASAVAHPNVITFVGQHEARSLVLVVNKPSIRAVEEPVLEEDGDEAQLFDGGVFLLDAVECIDIAVICNNVVSLDGVVEVFAVIQDLEFGLWVLFAHNSHDG